MNSTQDLSQSRRDFFTSARSGLGAVALASLCQSAPATEAERAANPLAPKTPHHQPRAKNCIFIFLAGGISQVELFDRKTVLEAHAGQLMPESFFRNERFSFIKRDESLVMPSRFGFRRYGASGIEMSELIPHIGSCADEMTLIRSTWTDEFDHAPGEIFFSTGQNTPGRPGVGSWVTYGLGSESANLPGYVVLIAGRSPVSRSAQWNNGLLPASTAGVLFRERGEPILNLANPPGVSDRMQRAQLDAIRALNGRRFEKFRDPEIENRISAYELAFRMQSSAPDLIDFGDETARTQRAYGMQRPGEPGSFSRNCLLARRLVERGVRFVSLFHRRWDHHSGLQEKLANNCRIIDQPIAALIHDLKQRGLLEETLVVCGTEFGRTPVTENAAVGAAAGRDHHRYGFSTWMAGGGVKAGSIVGRTDDFGWHAIEDRVHVNDFHATLLHLFGLDHKRLTVNSQGLDIRLTDQGGNVVKKILA